MSFFKNGDPQMLSEAERQNEMLSRFADNKNRAHNALTAAGLTVASSGTMLEGAPVACFTVSSVDAEAVARILRSCGAAPYVLRVTR